MSDNNKLLELQWDKLKSNVWTIDHIENPTEEMCLFAVSRAWNTLKYIKSPTYEVIRKAIDTKGWAIQYVENPLEELQIMAVEKDWDSIQYIKTPTVNVKSMAVRTDWRAIQFVDNPPFDVIREAVRQNEEAIRYIDVKNDDELVMLIEDNVRVIKYVGHLVSQDRVEEVLRRKLGEEDVDSRFVVDFIECDALKLDKVRFIKNHGSRKAKTVLVDYKLNF